MSPHSKISKIRFTVEEDEQMIEQVGLYECIWDMKHDDYKNTHKKDKVWQKIGHMLQRSRAECRSRWKSIRDHYKRQMKEEKCGTGYIVKKKRANYWNKLSFLDNIEDKGDSFSNIFAENIDYDPLETRPSSCSSIEDTLSLIKSEYETPPCRAVDPLQPSTEPEQISRTLDSPERETLGSPVHKRKREDLETEYLKETNNHSKQFNECIKDLMKPDEQDEINLFFKSIAMTVKKFSPELLIKTKLKIFEVVTTMDLLHQKRIHNDFPT